MYYPYYTETEEDRRARFSRDTEIRAEWTRIRSLNRLCHEILGLAKKGDTEALCRLLFDSSSEKVNPLTAVYPRFEFTAWLDPGGIFVARDVTIFQAALLQPEIYDPPSKDDGSIDGKHTGKAFLTLLSLLGKDDKLVFLNQDGAGRTVLHTLVSTRNEQSAEIQRLLRNFLVDKSAIQKELWAKRDKRGKRYDEFLFLETASSSSGSSNNCPSSFCVVL